MTINCDDLTVRKMAAEACNASVPMGLGFLYFKAGKIYTADEMQIYGNCISTTMMVAWSNFMH